MRVPTIPGDRAKRGDELAEAARRIAADLQPLMLRADQAGHRMLAYLLELAFDEATKRGKDGLVTK